MEKLPVFQTVKVAYQSLLENSSTAVKLCWSWFIVYYSFSAAVGYYALVEQQPLYAQTSSIAKVLVTAAIAVAWHRFIILKEQPRGLGAPLNRPVIAYLSIMIFATFIIMGPAIAANYFLSTSNRFVRFVGNPIIIMGFLAIVSIITAVALYRFTLILPAIAIDSKKFKAKESWRLTQKNTGRLLAGGLLSFIPISVIIYALGMIPYLLTGIENPTLLAVFWNLLSVIKVILEFSQIILIAAFLSFSYLFFCPEKKKNKISQTQ
ncbi:glycerophosphoryl diester phosphodiesterase membrane domain-containing protein [Motiliproteus sp. MSK22-1]|uniref:glycerophosphoryl diester phosphodiesterase membrane domain-containing protein n=1 Tax=Motiliproteus sp. MSK22-1 TaxID=1897630 RepID=UPI00097706C1|nr:glycerophosphoryl diester phosphodiesterase membrane domain-containing protein [Motiliproteus sp. MSK22-1]OMH39454.1 hypothetical protein BGP75_02340 [Motiliproteus sp. MSK22-1]